MPLIKKYFDFFKNTQTEQNLILQGGRRSGKTWAVLQWLVLQSFLNKNEIVVICPTFPMSTNLIKDLVNITACKMTKKDNIYLTQIGESVWSIFSAKKPKRAQGLGCDFLFLNEASNYSEALYLTASLGVRKQIIIDFNPAKKFWITKYINEKNFIKTTYNDNEYLTAKQIKFFDDIKEKYNGGNCSSVDKYIYNVYCNGIFSDAIGRVFVDVYAENINELNKPIIGVDFGFSNDAIAVVSVQFDKLKKCVYVKELGYFHGMDDLELGQKFIEFYNNGFIKNTTPIIFDWGAGGDARAAVLSKVFKKGNFVPAKKGKIIDTVGAICSYTYFVEGNNILAEMENYILNQEGKFEGEHHAIDAMRYALLAGFRANFWK